MGKLEKRNKDRMKNLKRRVSPGEQRRGDIKISWIINKRRGFTRRKERPLHIIFLKLFLMIVRCYMVVTFLGVGGRDEAWLIVGSLWNPYLSFPS